jgi:hypothetical protein
MVDRGEVTAKRKFFRKCDHGDLLIDAQPLRWQAPWHDLPAARSRDIIGNHN